MSSISVTVGEELLVSLSPDGHLLAFSTTAYLNNGDYRWVYGRDTVHFHGDPATLRAFAEKLLAAFPAEPVDLLASAGICACCFGDAGVPHTCVAPLVIEPTAVVACQHAVLRAEECSLPPCPETGYRDCGIQYACADCGEVFDEAELARERAKVRA